MTTGFLSLLIIIGRAYFCFQDQSSFAILLDAITMPLFTFLVIVNRKNIYAGIATFLPSVSLYLLIQDKPISDLVFVAFLLTTHIFFHRNTSIHIKNKGPIIYFIKMYLLLLFAYVISNCLNIYFDMQLHSSFLKFLNYLVLTLYASFAFLMVYRKEDDIVLSNAFTVAALAYMAASTLGYFYISNIDTSEYISDISKELFRYPGFSNSNYIGSAIILLTAIAYTLNKNRMYIYLPIVTMTAVLSQSRSIFFSSLIFLTICAVNSFKRHNISFKIFAKYLAIIITSAIFILLIARTEHKLKDVPALFIDRVSMLLATENISDRFNIMQLAINESSNGLKNLIFGVGYIQDGFNPHNSIVQALLLFGIMPMLIVLLYFIYVSWKIPIMLFAVFASLAEILFFTFSYDFLFFVLLVVNVHTPSIRSNRHFLHS